jgi:peptidoglycan/xylan/chitin deacetylase (PgdA/CDA1 family)
MNDSNTSRRNFLTSTLLAGAGFMVGTEAASVAQSAKQGEFWPNGARLAVSFSLMFEAGGQPISGAGGPVTEPILNGAPDLPTNSFFEYGVTEGIPRLLDLFDRHEIKVSSFMIGEAVRQRPDLAVEIVNRGHEAGAHGRTWTSSYLLSKEEEKAFIQDNVQTIKRVTGFQPVGWNAYWMRNSANTLEILQDLGFIYHIDDPSADEPFILPLRGKPFVTVPYTFHMNDISSFPFTQFDPHGYEQALKDEFDQLYEEGVNRRRMMVVSCHDRIMGHANRVRVLDRVIRYMKSKGDVWFARKDEIARWALQNQNHTPVVQRGPVAETGLPGPSA